MAGITKAERKRRKQSLNGGRPTVFTKEVMDKLDEAFSWGCTDAEAALHANITFDALQKHCYRHPDFVHRRNQLKETPNIRARQSVLMGFADNPDLALKYLERKKKDEFSTKQESDVKLTFEPLKISRADENDD